MRKRETSENTGGGLETSKHGKPDADAGDVARDLVAVGQIARRIRSRLARQVSLVTFLTEAIMGLNEDINTDLDALQTSITGIVDAYKADNVIIADLRAQLAAGPPGLTPEQGTAILDRLVANQKTIQDALAPVVEVPPIDGEPPVPGSTQRAQR